MIEIYDLSQAVLAKLANISTRAFVGTNENIVIAGFILGGHNGNDRIVVRGIGPSLTALGVANALANPTLELRDSNGALLVANNDWQDNPAQAAELTAAGLAPTNNLESGIAATLPPGLYTALLAGLNNGTGIGLVEVYDRGAPYAMPKLRETKCSRTKSPNDSCLVFHASAVDFVSDFGIRSRRSCSTPHHPGGVSDPALSVQFRPRRISVMQRREGVIVDVIRDAPALGDPFGLVE